MTQSHGVGSHFPSYQRRVQASKLGMWIFLGTELLLFGGLFCLYAIYRANHPEIFLFGAKFLDTNWGGLNTVVLLLSSFTMAMAVRAAQVNQRADLVLYLVLTLLCGTSFMGVKAIEYAHKFHDHLLWGAYFRPVAAAVVSEAGEESAAPAEAAAVAAGSADKGRPLYRATCASCHGMEGQGMPGQGRDIRESQFIAKQDDASLLAFIKKGRMPNDPANETGRMMPAKGGNPMLSDGDLLDIIAYLRLLQNRGAGLTPVAVAASGAGAAQAPPAGPSESQELEIHRWIVPLPPDGPPGLAAAYLAPPSLSEGSGAHGGDAPRNQQTFFAIYFSMTGLHALHVLAGMGVLSWLLLGALRGRFGADYYTPVDLGGLYWHLVDVIWIYLFPLLYLIH